MRSVTSIALSFGFFIAASFAFWPALRRRLILLKNTPRGIQEFAAASLSQGGVLKIAIYLGLLPLIDLRLPRWLTTFLCRTVGRQQGINFSELDRPLDAFGTINEFFTRPLRPGCRPICAERDAIIAPADADITEVGCLDHDKVILAKGVPYALEDFLPAPEARDFVGGSYVAMYLRPGNCHRIFSPVDAKVKSVIRIPGREFPISPIVYSLVPDVFVQNRRMAHVLETQYGHVVLVMVGAYKVGKMVPEFDPSFSSWEDARVIRRNYEPPPRIERGQWLSTFHLGSAVVLLFRPGTVEKFEVSVGASVKYGQKLASGKFLET